MMLIHSDDVVQQIAPTALNPSLGYAILPGAGVGSPNKTHTHGSRCCGNFKAVFGIAIEDQELWSGLRGLWSGSGVSQLTSRNDSL
jgi:hypothetical protein